MTTECECATGPVPGANWPAGVDGDRERSWVERCDICGVFADDDAAAEAVAAHVGTEVLWAKARESAGEDGKGAGDGVLTPFVEPIAPLSVHLVVPFDPSEGVAVFEREQDAQAYADTFTDTLDIDEVVVCDAVTGRKMVTDRWRAEYQAVIESTRAEADELSDEDLRRYVITLAAGDDDVRHIAANEREDVLAEASSELTHGWIPIELFDLADGSCHQLRIDAAVTIAEA